MGVGWGFMPTQVQAASSKERVRACVPHIPYTLVLKFVPPAGRVCGAATHAVGGDAGYGLLLWDIERRGQREPTLRLLQLIYI